MLTAVPRNDAAIAPAINRRALEDRPLISVPHFVPSPDEDYNDRFAPSVVVTRAAMRDGGFAECGSGF